MLRFPRILLLRLGLIMMRIFSSSFCFFVFPSLSPPICPHFFPPLSKVCLGICVVIQKIKSSGIKLSQK